MLIVHTFLYARKLQCVRVWESMCDDFFKTEKFVFWQY